MSYNRGNTDITSVEIGCGIDTISTQAFLNCTNLSNIIILGNIDIIDNYAFYYCNKLKTIKYYGTTSPTHGSYVFYGNNITNVQVTKDYEGEEFCGMPINRSL